jgi:hypothetical protein
MAKIAIIGDAADQEREQLSDLAAASRRLGPSAKARRFRKWVALTLRQPYQCMVPAHGSSLKPPPDTTPDDAGDPTRVVFWLGWVRASRDSSTVAGAHLRWLGSHARGDPQKATSTPREDPTRVFRKPASFLCAYVYLEGGARQVRGGQAVHPRRGPASPSISSSCRSRLRLRSRPAPLSACVLNRQFEIRR